MRTIRIAVFASSAALLFGCSALSTLSSLIPDLSAPPHRAANESERAGPMPGETQLSHSRLDAYKLDVAQHILSANSGNTFSGQLPPMLPAIVVVNIGIDADGNLSRAVVQRSRNHEASQVALASLRRVGPYPKPSWMLRSGGNVLEFSETFLFNADYKFQLRTLAGPQ